MKTDFQKEIEEFSGGCAKIGLGIIFIPVLIIIVFLLIGGLL